MDKNENNTIKPSTLYAPFGKRLLAFVIDIFPLAIGSAVLSSLKLSQGIISIAEIAYFVYMTYTYGATLGKMAMHIKVVDENTQKNLTIGQTLIRETIGKWISAVILFIGFFMVAFDDKSQGLHDKIAKTIVIITK